VDKDLKTRLKAQTAWKHNELDAWFAVAVEDYGQQRPRDAEMMQAAIERLENHFGDALELANKTLPAQLGGEECRCLRFKGTFNSVTWFGECYLLAHHGFGYWFFVGATSWDEAAQVKRDVEDDGKGFALLTERRGWREQPPPVETFYAQAAPLSVVVPKDVWERSAAREEEETGELYLFGRFLKGKDNRKNASILIFTADKKSDLKESLRTARAYLEKRKQEENPKYKYVMAQDGASESGSIEPVADRTGGLVELRLMFGDEPKRYTLLAVVHHDDKAFVIRSDCAWEHRQIWQQDFRNVLGTLRFGKQQ
jgi:hypothetical protein